MIDDLILAERKSRAAKRRQEALAVQRKIEKEAAEKAALDAAKADAESRGLEW